MMKLVQKELQINLNAFTERESSVNLISFKPWSSHLYVVSNFFISVLRIALFTQ